jgi:hypothetical protein
MLNGSKIGLAEDGFVAAVAATIAGLPSWLSWIWHNVTFAQP